MGSSTVMQIPANFLSLSTIIDASVVDLPLPGRPDTMISIPMMWICREAYRILDKYIANGISRETFDATLMISDILTDSIPFSSDLSYRTGRARVGSVVHSSILRARPSKYVQVFIPYDE